MSSIRVCHLCTHDILGGAARASYRLHTGLLQAGVDSSMLVLSRASDDPTVRVHTPGRQALLRLRRANMRRQMAVDSRRASRRHIKGDPFTDDRSPAGIDLSRHVAGIQILNLHWVAGFVDLTWLFSSLEPATKIVWTLHDQNAMTGGCHYDGGCDRFTKQCGACPQLGSDDEHDLSNRIWIRKFKALSHLQTSRVRIVGCCRWASREASRSGLLSRFQVQTINYGLDSRLFCPRDRSASRSVLGIPENARVLLFVAASIDDERKGFSYLRKALEQLSDVPELLLVSVGARNVELTSVPRHLHLGKVESDYLLSIIYSSADVFVIPSLQEAMAQTALEATACGTAAVGFDVGGIPDVIQHGVNGELAQRADSNSLGLSIGRMLRNLEYSREMGRRGRQLVEERFTLAHQAANYMKLYEDLLGTRPKLALSTAASA